MGNGKTLDGILSDLANEGYTTEQFIIPACAIGAWHRRDRIWILAYTLNNTDRANRGQKGKTNSISELNREAGLSGKFGGTGEDVPDTNRGRCEEQWVNKSIQQNIKRETESIESQYSGCSNGQESKTRARQSESRLGGVVNGLPYWLHEPDGVPRVATRIKNRVDRLKGLGNAIVPQVAYQIFKTIEQYEMS